MKSTLAILPLLLAAAVACAQNAATTGPAAPAATAPAAAAPEVMATLKMLQDRKGTLKDFTGKIENSVEHMAGDREGNLGTLDFVNDAGGTRYAAHFTLDTEEGKPKAKHERDIVFDGKTLTLIDQKSKTFKQFKYDKVDQTAFSGPLPLPIGVPVEKVVMEFVVTQQPSKDGNLQTLRFVPRVKGNSEYSQLDLTVDNKLQLPVQVIAREKGGDITTIKITEPKINTGAAKIPDVSPPKAPGWNIEIKGVGEEQK